MNGLIYLSLYAPLIWGITFTTIILFNKYNFKPLPETKRRSVRTVTSKVLTSAGVVILFGIVVSFGFPLFIVRGVLSIFMDNVDFVSIEYSLLLISLALHFLTVFLSRRYLLGKVDFEDMRYVNWYSLKLYLLAPLFTWVYLTFLDVAIFWMCFINAFVAVIIYFYAVAYVPSIETVDKDMALYERKKSNKYLNILKLK